MRHTKLSGLVAMFLVSLLLCVIQCTSVFSASMMETETAAMEMHGNPLLPPKEVVGTGSAKSESEAGRGSTERVPVHSSSQQIAGVQPESLLPAREVATGAESLSKGNAERLSKALLAFGVLAVGGVTGIGTWGLVDQWAHRNDNSTKHVEPIVIPIQ